MLLLIEGFEGASSLAGSISAPMKTMLERKGHYIYNSVRSDAGRVSGVSTKIDSSSYRIRLHYSTTDDTIIFGFGFKTNTWDAVARNIMFLSHSTATVLATIQTCDTDEWRIILPSAGTYTTSNNSGGGTGWYYVECKIVFGESGSFEFKVNGVTELSDSAIDTNIDGKLSSYLRFVVPGSGAHWFDDVYICDSVGSENNDFLGICQVIGLFPDGNGTQNDFTPSAGDNYENVDEQDTDDDTTYNTGDHGDIDYYTYDAIEHNNIFGIQVNTTVRLTDAENMAIKSKVKSDSSVDTGDARYINVDYTTEYEIIVDDPDTSLPWTKVGINNAEFGLEII